MECKAVFVGREFDSYFIRQNAFAQHKHIVSALWIRESAVTHINQVISVAELVVNRVITVSATDGIIPFAAIDAVTAVAANQSIIAVIAVNRGISNIVFSEQSVIVRSEGKFIVSVRTVEEALL